jgi:hypothetical protein
MATTNDELWKLEQDIAKYPPGQPGSAINLRMILREALERVRAAGRQEGYSDGLRDQGDAQHKEAEWARKAEEAPDA